MTLPESTSLARGKTIWVPLLSAMLMIGAIWLTPLALKKWAGAEGWTSLGDFGSIFGLPSAVFSGLAFVCVTLTLLLQRDELALQREELRQTREVMSQQQAEMKRNADFLAKQTFETTFFQLVGVINEVRDHLRPPVYHGPDGVGRVAFQEWVGRLRQAIPSGSEIPGIEKGYAGFYLGSAAELLGHYFRCVYVTLKFVDESSVEDKRTYTRIVRAQMSNNELVMLFYNALSEFGREKMLPLVERYDMFDNMPSTHLVNANHRLLIKSSYADFPKQVAASSKLQAPVVQH